MHLVLFFTYQVSLQKWKESGLFDREIRLYNEMISSYGVSITFLTYGDKKDKDLESKIRNIKVIPIYEKIYRPKNKIIRFIKSLFIPFYFKNELKDCDIYKTNQMWGSWIALISKLLYKKPLIVRCGWEKYFNSLQGYDNSNKYFTWFVSKVIYFYADEIILSSNHLVKFVINTFKINKNKINYISNWIDTSLFKPSKQKNNKILYVGRFTKEKNIDLLLDALSGSEFSIDILGYGPEKARIIDKIKKLNINVNLLDPIPNTQMAELYSKYPIYILCSRVEGNPKTLLEAMSSGCAVIGTDVHGIRDVIIHGKTGLLTKENANDLSKTLIKLRNNVKLRKLLGTNAREQIIANNSLNKIMLKELLLYEKCIENT